MITLINSPNEESAMAFNIIITDGNGVVVPLIRLTSVRWQLSDISGNVINDNTFENGLVTDNPIVLYDVDLAMTNTGPGRIIAVKAVYDSTLGAGLTGTEEAEFDINNLVNF